jgi:hypothetical protein
VSRAKACSLCAFPPDEFSAERVMLGLEGQLLLVGTPISHGTLRRLCRLWQAVRRSIGGERWLCS